MRRKSVVWGGVLFLIGPIMLMQACGPDFEPDLFVPAHRPTAPQNFAKGELGVLQPGYFIAEKVVAFRYLNGGTLNEEEQRQLLPVVAPGLDYDRMTDEEAKAAQAADNAPSAADRWNLARLAYGQAVSVSQKKPDPFPAADGEWKSQIVNCSDSAFNTAIDTLSDRSVRWGKDSAALKDWLTAQDAVFLHCSGDGAMPAATKPDAPLLLKQDRAYQIAAATFYRGDYLIARDAFLAIAQDNASPWSKWGMYLAARCTVRQAAKVVVTKDEGSQAVFDQAGMQAARQMLLQAATSSDPRVKHAAQAELNFVMIRLDPVKQVALLANTLAGPGHDSDFGQHLVDLRFLLDQGKYGDAPLLHWMTMSGSPVAYSMPLTPGVPQVAPSAESEWQKHPNLPNLVGALMNAKSGTPALLQAASAVPESSPAYVTVQFHHARLLAEANDLKTAREITTHTLDITRKRHEVAATNALLEVRMKTASDFTSLLQDAPRTMLSAQSQAASNVGCDLQSAACKSKISEMQFDEDAAQLFNIRLPLNLWMEAANNEALPKHLRDTIALSAWLRALILQRDADAKALMPLLPPRVQASLAKSDDPTGYAATLVLLHSPGLRPFLDAGVQRAATYTETDSFRNNLWCSTMEKALEPDEGRENAPVLAISEPVFLTPEQKQQAKTELAGIDAHSNGMEWLGRRTIDYVRAHPQEPVAAESLALVVKLTRYECYKPDEYGKSASSNVSKEAFTLLHSKYPKSDWAEKTKYFF